MTDRPILFSGPMVRALLDGRKTQTRRVLNPQPAEFTPQVIDIGRPYFDDEEGRWGQIETEWSAPSWDAPLGEPLREVFVPLPIRFAVGDRLYVRETFSGPHGCRNLPPRDWPADGPRWYWADGDPHDGDWTKPKPGMHMPRSSSRLTLIVCEVRVERLQDISEADALAEGIHVQRLAEWAARGEYVGVGNKPVLMAVDDPRVTHMAAADADCSWGTAREAYRELWDDLNFARGFGWDANPWVVAVTFGVVKANIDAVERAAA